MAALAPTPKFQAINSVGVPYVGAKLYTYASGTTTPQTTYTSSAQTTANANPVILDSRGEADVWLNSSLSYKLVLKDPNDVEIWTVDKVNGDSVLAGSGGSGGIGFIQPYSGAVARTVQAKLRDTVCVLDFDGVDSTGATDSTAGMQAAHDSGVPVYYPPGTYKYTTITIDAGGIIGAGEYDTQLYCSNTGGGDTITYTGALAGTFRDFNIYTPTPATSGTAIAVDPGSGEVSGMRFLNVVFNNWDTGLHFKRASLWSVTDCNFYEYVSDGILVDNLNAPDSGDSSIKGCVFTAPSTSGNGVRQVASGGLKLTGNKFNNGGTGYLLDLSDGGDTGVLVISGNSFENSSFANIQLQRQAATTKIFTNVVICGNEFLVSGATASAIYSNNGSDFLYNVAITGNTIQLSAITQAGILLDYVERYIISGNEITGFSGGTGIYIGTNGSGRIGRNYITLCDPNVNIGEDGAGNTVGGEVDRLDYQRGYANVTLNTGAYGSFFYGSVTVTFTTPFLILPTQADVTAGLTNLVDGAIGVAVSTITRTQLTILVFGETNAAVVPIYWRVNGFLDN